MAIENATFHVKTGDFFEEVSFNDPKINKIENYTQGNRLDQFGISQWLKNLGMTLDKTVVELFDMLPQFIVVNSIFCDSGVSVYAQSLPVKTGGFVSIGKEDRRGYIEFIDYRKNKKYIKSNIDNTWSEWENSSDSEIIGTTDISSIADGTITGGLSEINSNLSEKGKLELLSSSVKKGSGTYELSKSIDNYTMLLIDFVSVASSIHAYMCVPAIVDKDLQGNLINEQHYSAVSIATKSITIVANTYGSVGAVYGIK